MPSIGPIKIPLISELDPKGFNDAKVRAQGLRQAAGSGAGPAAPQSPPSASAGGRSSAAASALSRIAGSAPGGAGLAGIIGEAGAGPVAAALAVYATSQIAAQSANEMRRNNREAGITSETYGRLAASSRSVGIGIEETMAGMKKATATFEAAALHGNAGESLFLKSLGLSDSQISRGLDNADTMVNTLRGKNLSDVQKTALFGSIAAGNAAMAKGDGSFFAPTAGESRNARQMAGGIGDMTTKAAGTWGSIIKGAWNDPLGAITDPFGTAMDQIDKDQIEARREEERQQAADAETRRRRAGNALAGSLLNPLEQQQLGLSNLNAMTLPGGGRFRNLASAGIAEQRLGAERGFMTAREAADAEGAIAATRAANGGYSTAEQAGRARLGVDERLQSQIRAHGSNRENLESDMSLASRNWQLSSGRDRTDVARGLGDTLTDAVESMTRAGGQVGANGINTAAGASMVMGAEYQMDQSQNTIRMVELLVKIAENTGHLDKLTGDDVLNNLGYRQADPISAIFGGN